MRWTMPPGKSQNCQKTLLSACLIISCVVLEGLLIYLVAHLLLSWTDVVRQSSNQDLTKNHSENTFGCTSKLTVVTDEALRQKWEACSANFSQAWKNLEQSWKRPPHSYLETQHSSALHLFTSVILQPVNRVIHPADRTPKQKHTFELFSLFSTLSEAIQIIKHNQVMCLNTIYRTETVLLHNVLDQLVRFDTFILGSDEPNVTGNVSCFEIYSCFGADVTQYSALNLKKQMLIPPYEVFMVTDIQNQTDSCKVIYKLRSNMNCVYDRDSNRMHSISAFPMEGFWLIFTIICLITLSLLLPCVFKLHHELIMAYRCSSVHCTAVML
ncbi:T-cell ecto-ADP-ribosyltransferase 2 isoform X2 [Nothobranchius furzeri]|uniref:NAD(P)(+)--arginine ADP-ribosyltransferase n=1 Tax=Nothobranchius furzeri TaxID=105023 RepID=A0A9D2YNH7_NOTFU|nr:ecto-ADP-ribosyltransferase 4 isoform X2 [Nothobranchius furzeri]XP_054599521.1 ecto-ADP-ribosyltransferase 4 isoform X2 [Nothobranchius furzeri]KAF7223827.1 ecto-ADP-ribosyltransferase 4-like [Nothobranchius furzeri]